MAKATICILEDDDAVRDSMSWLLTLKDYRVIDYKLPSSFLREVETVRPDCLLSDFRLPEMSGLEVQAYLKKKRLLIPVIFISGHADAALLQDIDESGALGLLLKPINDKELFKLIAIACHHQA